MTHEERLRRIACAMGLVVSAQIDAYKPDSNGPWWIKTGPNEAPMPMTTTCSTLPKALVAAEGWLLPELQEMAKKA